MAAEPAPIERRLLSDAVYERLLAQVLDAAPGEALASERALSVAFGVNRHAVREALKRLQQAGLVEIAQGGATRVADWRRTAGLDLLTSLTASAEGVDHADLLHAVAEMRACVGIDVARRAAERDPDSGTRALDQQAADPFERYVAFWEAITDGAGNVAYRLALNTLVAAQRGGGIDPSIYTDEVADTRAHEALARAIAAGDPDAAAARAADLLNRTVEALTR